MTNHSRPLVLLTLVLAGTLCLAAPVLAQTPGYWKTHADPEAPQYDATWDLVGGADATFLNGNDTWLEVLWKPAEGNPYYILGKQFVAATLNVKAERFENIRILSSSEVTESGVVNMIDRAEGMLRGLKTTTIRTSADFQDPGTPTRADMIELAESLDRFNNMVAAYRDAMELETGSDNPPVDAVSWGSLKTRYMK